MIQVGGVGTLMGRVRLYISTRRPDLENDLHLYLKMRRERKDYITHLDRTNINTLMMGVVLE